jgi:hypothetical protein
MTIWHPFDASLREVAPGIRRIDAADFTSDETAALAITFIVVTRPVLSVDGYLVRQDDSWYLRTVQPLPFILYGAGVGQNGSISPDVIAAAPCSCAYEAYDPERWNPLCIAFAWEPELPGQLANIVQAYLSDLEVISEFYCPWGMSHLHRTLVD